jgi:hypothetical protein
MARASLSSRRGKPDLALWAQQARQISGWALQANRGGQRHRPALSTFPILGVTTAMFMCFVAHSATGYGTHWTLLLLSSPINKKLGLR